MANGPETWPIEPHERVTAVCLSVVALRGMVAEMSAMLLFEPADRVDLGGPQEHQPHAA